MAIALAFCALAALAVPPTPCVGNYRSAHSGAFTNSSTQEIFVTDPSATATDGYYVAASAVPTAADGTILIRAPHTVTLATAATLNDVYIKAGSTLGHSGTADLSITASAVPRNLIVEVTYRELSTSGRLVAAPGASAEAAPLRRAPLPSDR